MKKGLVILISLMFFTVALPAVLGDTSYDHYNYDRTDYKDNMPYRTDLSKDYPTTVTIATSNGDPDYGGAQPAIIKAKWETPDDDTTVGLTQIAPNPGTDKEIKFYVVVKEGTGELNSVWVDVWHPDGTFKYEVQLTKLDQTTAQAVWESMVHCNLPAVTFNEDYYNNEVFNGGATRDKMAQDITEELQQHYTYIYEGEATLSYCQPAGWYTVAALAYDNAAGWSQPLWNWFWYIPVAAYETDFTSINYGNIHVSRDAWIDGDYDMSTPSQPTVRNIGNCPIDLTVYQDDMGFGNDGQGNYYVKYDVRLGHTVDHIYYNPFEEVIVPGGPIPLCTEEKIDFSIHVIKPTQESGTGTLTLTAYISPDPFTEEYWTPDDFKGTQPQTVPDPPSLVPDNLPGPTPLPSD